MSDLYSDMLMTVMLFSPPNMSSAKANAVSVFPVPEGPTSMKTPIGNRGSLSPARLV